MSLVSYRTDIDGLRALAVMAVFVFHLSHSYLPGGFLGVDIFFVISGYLISQLLLKEITQTGIFNIKEFFKRRMKRILPSFYVVILASILLALLLFMPEDLVHFAKSVKSAVLVKSNFYFGDFKSYFSIDSDEFPLLHTWSLSIEEQFYFIWPIIFNFCLKNLKPKTIFFLLLITILILLSIGQYHSDDAILAQKSYFFNLPRFGEILIGALAALSVTNGILLPNKVKITNILSFISILMIFFSMFLITKDSIYPGFLSFLPCVGTYLFLISGSISQTFLHRFFAVSPLRWIGIHSYGIYLWHWPILAFYRYSTGVIDVPPMIGLIILLISLILSFFSRRIIEIPAIKLNIDFNKTFLIIFLIPGLTLLITSYALRWSKGVPQRINQLNSYVQESAPIRNNYCHDSNGEVCLFNAGKEKKILLFGDSIAGYHAPILLKAFADNNIEFSVITSNRCAPIIMNDESVFYVNRLDIKKCFKTINAVKDLLTKKFFDVIFISGKWSNITKYKHFEKKFLSSLKTLKTKTNHIIVFGALPYFENRDINHFRRARYSPLLSKFSSQKDFIKIDFSKDEELRLKGDEAIQHIIKDIASVHYFHILKFIDKKNIHLPIDKGEMLYSDSYHLNDYGAQYIGEQIYQDIFEAFLDELSSDDLNE